MSSKLQAKWDARYTERTRPPDPSPVLADYAHLLPAQGRALDLACGLGANALFLAQRGLETLAWDISPVAVERVRGFASERGVRIDAAVRDVVDAPPPRGAFDVIVVSHFLERGVAPRLIDAMRDRGLLFYQTFVREQVSGAGPSNPSYRLGENELLALFGSLRILLYREEGMVGDVSAGLRDVAQLVGQKRAP
jgi:SAM-dependent methyltransferase